jgi:cytochrome c peroxidase
MEHSYLLSKVTGLAVAVALAGAAVTAQATFDRLPQPPSDRDFLVHNDAKVDLGKVLFYDKILSGNRNMSCASCHHALAGLGDGLSLPIGEGGRGLGITRDTGTGKDAIHGRVPRNAPQFFNQGAFEFRETFWDGRVEVCPSEPSGFCSPAGDDLPSGLDNVLAVQAMFPITSLEEMAGQPGENPVADAAAVGNLAGPGGVWQRLTWRIRQNPEYVALFKAAYPGEVTNKTDITIVHVANAIAAYEDRMFRAINSPFDRFLRGERGAMSQDQTQGMQLFYGKAGCANCHSGAFQTDHQYHAICFPQIGPGKGDTVPGGTDSFGDLGREAVTGDPADRFKFRTSSLRNVALTGPWGHAGAYNSLEAVIRHKLNPVESMEAYDPSQAVLPSRPDLDRIDLVHHADPANRAAMAEFVDPPLLETPDLSDKEIALLIEFLHALTDPSSVDLRHTVPAKVPSGLPLWE